MRLVVLLALACACKSRVAPSPPAATTAFEGEIDGTHVLSFRPDEPTTTFEYVVEIKGHKVRMEEKPTGYVTITDGDAKKSWSLEPKDRTYVETNLVVDPIEPTTKSAGTDVILGTPCEKFELEEFGDHTTVWLAPSIRVPFVTRAAHMDSMSSIERDRLFEKGFPLRIEKRMQSGFTSSRVEVTRITRRPVADSDLVVPPGYTQVEASTPLRLGGG